MEVYKWNQSYSMTDILVINTIPRKGTLRRFFSKVNPSIDPK